MRSRHASSKKPATPSAFTSRPSLVDVGERISVNGAMLSPEDFLDAFDVVWSAIGSVSEDDPVTVFEVFTAMAIVHFVRKKVDIVVWEVGLGGLYDATNVIPVPEVAVITNIGLEHTDRLGNTVEEIATQKAGIIKQGGIDRSRSSGLPRRPGDPSRSGRSHGKPDRSLPDETTRFRRSGSPRTLSHSTTPAWSLGDRFRSPT